MNKAATAFYKKMFPNLVSQFPITDPDFYNTWHNFMYDEVIHDVAFDDRTRLMCILSACISVQAIDEFNSMVKGAYQIGVTPIEIKEIIYQAVPYCGIARVLPFLISINKYFKELNIHLPLEDQSVTDEHDRLEKGEACLSELNIDTYDLYHSHHQDTQHIHTWIKDNCFGDFYTRKGLTPKQRSMIILCLLIGLKVSDDQLITYMKMNLSLGNDIHFLSKIISQILPFIGYPQAIHALECLESLY